MKMVGNGPYIEYIYTNSFREFCGDMYIYICISCWKRKSRWKVTRQVRDHGKSETWYDDAE